jgi:hypothetical protein
MSVIKCSTFSMFEFSELLLNKLLHFLSTLQIIQFPWVKEGSEWKFLT